MNIPIASKMHTTAMNGSPVATQVKIPSKRIESIDLLRGVVMIIMALDHVRDYFHYDAFFYSPTDLSKTTVVLFFTRWITHFCAPVFIFLAGTSAWLYGVKHGRKALSFFLLTRGIWLILVELFILGLFRTFNPSYTYFNLQVIFAIGACMVVLSVIIYLNWQVILAIGILLIAAHNLLDAVHVPGNNVTAFIWSLIHESKRFSVGNITVLVRYPVLPWIGVMATGYCIGRLYEPTYDPQKRREMLSWLGLAAIAIFIILRAGNFYGDAAHWSPQKNFMFSVLSFVNVTKYPPSLLYILMTLGPALIFLSVSETPLKKLGTKIVIFGRSAMFYYLAHILLIHIFALAGVLISGYKLRDMILSTSVNDSPNLKGYGFNLITVYFVWIVLVIILYPLCRSFYRYKAANQTSKRWLSYL